MSFKSDMEYRIRKGLSKIYPDRASYYLLTKDYFFCNQTCTVYICAEDVYSELTPEIFKELINSYWTEERNDLHHAFHTISYNQAIPSDSDGDTFLDQMEDINSPVPEREYFLNDIRNRYSSVLDNLTPIQKTVVHGIYFEQKTELDIAKALGKTQANIHYHKIKALGTLRKLFSENEELLKEYDFEL